MQPAKYLIWSGALNLVSVGSNVCVSCCFDLNLWWNSRIRVDSMHLRLADFSAAQNFVKSVSIRTIRLL